MLDYTDISSKIEDVKNTLDELVVSIRRTYKRSVVRKIT